MNHTTLRQQTQVKGTISHILKEFLNGVAKGWYDTVRPCDVWLDIPHHCRGIGMSAETWGCVECTNPRRLRC